MFALLIWYTNNNLLVPGPCRASDKNRFGEFYFI